MVDSFTVVAVVPVGAVFDEGLASRGLAILQVPAIAIVEPEVVVVPDSYDRCAAGQACQRYFVEKSAVFAANLPELDRIDVRRVARKAEQVGRESANFFPYRCGIILVHAGDHYRCYLTLTRGVDCSEFQIISSGDEGWLVGRRQRGNLVAITCAALEPSHMELGDEVIDRGTLRVGARYDLPGFGEHREA